MTDAPDQPELDSTTSGRPTASLSRIVTKNELCQLLRISGGLFDRLMRDGAPYINRGERYKGHWQVNVADFVKFMVDDAIIKAGHSRPPDGPGMSLDEAKRKDKEVQANIRELELLKLQGEQVDVEDARKVLREVFAITRSRLQSIGTQIIGLSHNQQRDLDEALNDALTELSEGRTFNFGTDGETSLSIAQH